MKQLIAFILALFLTNGINAQDPLATDLHTKSIDILQQSAALGLSETQFDAIKDQAYENPNFVSGIIFQENTPVKTGVPMRYNAFADEIEIENAPGSYSSLMKDPEIAAGIGNDVYIYHPQTNGYFNILFEGKRFHLYKKVKSEFREGKEAATSYGRNTPPSFQKSTTYFLVEDNSLKEIPSRKNRILKMFGNKRKEVDSFIKSNRLDIGKEEDLVKVISHLDDSY